MNCTSIESEFHHCSEDQPSFSRNCHVVKFKIDIFKIQTKECISKAYVKQKLLKQFQTKNNFANAVKKIPNLNRTNSPSTSNQGFHQPDEDSKGTGETYYFTKICRDLQNEKSSKDKQSSENEQPSSPRASLRVQ